MDNVQRVWFRAEEVFGNKAKAATWLSQPRTSFGEISALEYACTEAGYLLVMDMLAQLDHGFGL
ncbi:hypothetical protein D3C76_805810 [compost metagenome]|uniref:DUF2384 domain-containing protein n=1 Tax=Pseudomonas corrugata TaxID=47879 RepID=A0A8B6URK5_9PSED|nr:MULTISPECIES: MbcA/ParS/Xre antitoxin family protein [Pseudomonas]QTH14532.1 DUF2384 domain-containing protein [Pseudomonas corrugata]